MDPCRIRSYLQVACAGLGFEIGEIWWTSNEHGSSTVAAIEERPTYNNGQNGALVKADGQERGKLRFVQLYTSKSYENRRSMLVTPPEDEEEEDDSCGMSHNHHHHHDHECTKDDLEKHVLSPRLVGAISKTAQVVWANTLKQEGLTGRSDIPLHTAVGMPVAVDAHGNMCVVVMFSPSNIQSTDEAMEYLHSISMSATSSSIPCLMPAFDKTDEIMHVPTSRDRKNAIRGHIMSQEASLGEGVTARFVSIDEHHSGSSTPDEKKDYDLSTAPKDSFGIPMLPCFAELENDAMASPAPAANAGGRASPSYEDIFDEASYGVWSTIMQERPSFETGNDFSRNQNDNMDDQSVDFSVDNSRPMGLNEGNAEDFVDEDVDPMSLVTKNKRSLDRKRKEQLEEFCSAFLGMSVFDIADVWIPAGPENPDCLSHVTSLSSNNQSNAVSEFKRVSGYTLIKYWSGAVGRAYSSGNPVWSCNPDVFVDKGRAAVFEKAKIATACAVPIVVGGRATPVGVVCCYSMLQSGSVPFVLRFVSQALHLLWSGLDKVQPHESVGQEIWQDVGPADLGEMAADVEMQHHFINKKRPRSQSVVEVDGVSKSPPDEPDQSVELRSQFKNFDFNNKNEDNSIDAEPPYSLHQYDQYEPELFIPDPAMTAQAYQEFQSHIRDAVKQVGEAVPFSHHHIATTQDGSKRAHVGSSPPKTQSRPPPKVVGNPLAMPHALPRQVVKSSYGQRVDIQNLSPQMLSSTTSQITKNLAGIGRRSSQDSNASEGSASQPSSAPQYRQYTQQMREPGAPMQNSTAPFATSQAPPTVMGQQELPMQDATPQFSNQQYQLDGQSQFETQMYQASAPSVAPMDFGSYRGNTDPQFAPVAPPPSDFHSGSIQQQTQQQPLSSNQFCIPTASGTYPVPDPEATISAPQAAVVQNGKAKTCRIQGCKEPCADRRPYCLQHSGNRLCEHEGCQKCAQGSTRFCIAHGGGRRCTFPGCDKGARDKFFCAAHGGGKRCKAEGCNKSAVGGSSLCTAHGGGRRCSIEGCDKSAQSSTKFCVKHGGGKKCAHEGCEKVARGRTQYCAAHGGGVRCKLDGCNRVAIGKMQLCRAHGGGSRTRSKKKTNQAQPPMQGNNIFGGEQPPSQHFTMDYHTPTSV